MFYLNFSECFIDALSQSMQEVRYGPDEVIYNEYSQNDAIYFIMRGEVEIFNNSKIFNERTKSEEYMSIKNL